MYGKSPVDFPRRIVCLSAEHVEICYALGAGDRVVGVPGTAHRPPEARDKPKVGGFTTFRVDRILALEPDLVLAFSDLQADVVAELIRAGLPVFCSNPRSMDDVLQSILMVGGLLGRRGGGARGGRRHARRDQPGAGVLHHVARPAAGVLRGVARPADHRHPVGVRADRAGRRPGRVRGAARAPERAGPGGGPGRGGRGATRSSSWCPGAASRPTSSWSAGRPGWERISAVREGRVHEVDASTLLSPGPALLTGLRACTSSSSRPSTVATDLDAIVSAAAAKHGHI